MHPFQSQVSKMWELIKLQIRAQRNESWIEAISLSYTLLEVELRLLLSSSAGKSGKLIPPEDIYRLEYLMSLAKKAKEEGFIDDGLLTKIGEFNNIRRKVIHRIIMGEISYEDLKEPAIICHAIMGEIQNCWIRIEWGPEERLEDKRNGKNIK